MKISAYSGQMNDPGFEQMTVSTPTKGLVVVKAELNPSQQVIYDNFVAVLGSRARTIIDNNPFSMDIDHVTSESITQSEQTLDYAGLAPLDQGSIESFNNLVNML